MLPRRVVFGLHLGPVPSDRAGAGPLGSICKLSGSATRSRCAAGRAAGVPLPCVKPSLCWDGPSVSTARRREARVPGSRRVATGSQQCCAKAGGDARACRRQSRFAWRAFVTTARSALRARVLGPVYLHAVRRPHRQGLPAPLRVDTGRRTLAWQWPTLLLHSGVGV